MNVIFGNRFDPRTYDEFAPPPGIAVDDETGAMTCTPTDRIGIIWLLVNHGERGKEYEAHQIAGELNCHAPYGSVAISKVIHRLDRLTDQGLLSVRNARNALGGNRLYKLTALGYAKQAERDAS
jgi:hypothetical protein